jgi:hypothetical protein
MREPGSSYDPEDCQAYSSGLLPLARTCLPKRAGSRQANVSLEDLVPVRRSTPWQSATGDGDSGSPEVQVAVMSRRILYLTERLRMHQRDHDTRRGLMALVGRRRRMLA